MQTAAVQRRVELLARHAGLHAAVEVSLVDLEHGIHARKVDADATVQRRDAAFARGSGAEGDHRHRGRVAKPRDRGHFLSRFGEHHRVWGMQRMEGHVLAVLVAHRLAGRAAIAKTFAQLPNHRGYWALVQRKGFLIHAYVLQAASTTGGINSMGADAAAARPK